jgi:hypothetical protein
LFFSIFTLELALVVTESPKYVALWVLGTMAAVAAAAPSWWETDV